MENGEKMTKFHLLYFSGQIPSMSVSVTDVQYVSPEQGCVVSYNQPQRQREGSEERRSKQPGQACLYLGWTQSDLSDLRTRVTVRTHPGSPHSWQLLSPSQNLV